MGNDKAEGEPNLKNVRSKKFVETNSKQTSFFHVKVYLSSNTRRFTTITCLDVGVTFWRCH